MTRAALLVLADGRFPAGGHAHSGGAEAAVRAGRITGAADLEDFCRGRLHTAGLVAAALAAAAALGVDPVALDEAADARTPHRPCAAPRASWDASCCGPPGPPGPTPNSTRWRGRSPGVPTSRSCSA